MDFMHDQRADGRSIGLLISQRPLFNHNDKTDNTIRWTR